MTHFAIVAPGLEAVARAELKRHGFKRITETAGGCFFEGSALRANRCLAIPSRILTRVARFPSRTFAQIIDGAAAVDWTPYGGLTPKVTSQKSRLYHSGAIEERLRAVVPKGPVTLMCRLNRDRCDLSVDTTGERLHRRGWRTEAGGAPLRETLAAGVLALGGWSPGMALFDPMCGAGTFLIEAASAAMGLCPGRLRSFACEAWIDEPPVPVGAVTPTVIEGRDRSTRMTEIAGRNAARAGVQIKITAGRARDAEPPAETGLLVCNPPYGRRAGGAAAAFEALGQLLSGPFAGWRAAVLCPDLKLARHIKRPIADTHRLRNGGMLLKLLIFEKEG